MIFFFTKIGIFCKSIACPVSEAKTHWMVNCYQLLNQLNFLCSLCKIRLNDVSKMFNYWERRWIDVDGAHTHTFCHSSNIFGCMHCFWLFTLWFIDEDASFFHFFHKTTNVRSWRCFSFSKIRMQYSYTFCNINMIFKVMSQYFPALFKRVGLLDVKPGFEPQARHQNKIQKVFLRRFQNKIK